ncbi:rhomboid family intramembrane serine protease [bacterium]|nr:rhomboid family intramembrane serine protease [bacterium]
MLFSLHRYRFTTAATVVLLGFALCSESSWQPLDETWRDWIGFAPTNLLDFQWQRLLTSLLLTAGGWRFAASLVMLAACVGLTERCYGTPATIKLFLTSHLLVLITISVTVLVLATNVSSPSILALAKGRDIGPSAGYYGCLGAILMSSQSLGKRLCILCVLSILLVRLTISTAGLPEDASVVSADIAHLLALPLGGFLAWCGYVSPLPDTQPQAPIDPTSRIKQSGLDKDENHFTPEQQ